LLAIQNRIDECKKALPLGYQILLTIQKSQM